MLKDSKKINNIPANNTSVIPKAIENAFPDAFFDTQSIVPPPSAITPVLATKESASNTANISAGFFDPIEVLESRIPTQQYIY